MKRAFDLFFSAIGLIVALPIIGILVLAIRFDSPGAAIFRQARVGRNGKSFVCLKLRTMFKDAPEVPTHMSSAGRVTPIGQHLRKWKLDELPQLWNVFVGEMSFVGPRPCLPSQTELVEERRKRGVLALRPGITGLAQIRGIDMSDPVALAELDAAYLRKVELYQDLRILIGTFSGSAMADRTNRS
jgi:O-antigen biosynthesis protein WbqP